MRGRTDQPLRHRKARDRAAILPLVGVILFLPPMAAAFRVDATLGGIPLLVVCIFGVWAALIAGAAALAPRLSDAEAAEDTGGGADRTADGVAAGAGDGAGDGPADGAPHGTPRGTGG